MGSKIVQGKVKWFNSRAGYGFLTVITKGENENDDIFVHHSGLDIRTEQYKYLVTGEYVEFVLTETNDSQHKFQADCVTGIEKGHLMCETRNLTARKNVGSGRGRTRKYVGSAADEIDESES